MKEAALYPGWLPFFWSELLLRRSIQWDCALNGRLVISTQFKFIVTALLILGATCALAQDDTQDVGNPFPGENAPIGAFPGLTELGAQLDLFYMYTNFSGEDMSESYGGMSQFGTGISMATGDRTRFFISARYGQSTGDPYYDIEGMSNEDGITVKALPIMFGMKINASRRQDFRLYVGGAFQFAFIWENLSTSDVNGNPMDVEASGTGTGYNIFIAPEFPLSDSKALGAELSWGGTKGDITDTGHSHAVDLTGFSARLYFTFGL